MVQYNVRDMIFVIWAGMYVLEALLEGTFHNKNMHHFYKRISSWKFSTIQRSIKQWKKYNLFNIISSIILLIIFNFFFFSENNEEGIIWSMIMIKCRGSEIGDVTTTLLLLGQPDFLVGRCPWSAHPLSWKPWRKSFWKSLTVSTNKRQIGSQYP